MYRAFRSAASLSGVAQADLTLDAVK